MHLPPAASTRQTRQGRQVTIGAAVRHHADRHETMAKGTPLHSQAMDAGERPNTFTTKEE